MCKIYKKANTKKNQEEEEPSPVVDSNDTNDSPNFEISNNVNNNQAIIMREEVDEFSPEQCLNLDGFPTEAEIWMKKTLIP